jgi:hypothetical protein
MAQITLRGIDPRIEADIRKMAKQSGKSINRVILDMLYEHTGYRKKRAPRADSLRDLAGGWSEEDASAFFESIASCEKIDEQMWQ